MPHGRNLSKSPLLHQTRLIHPVGSPILTHGSEQHQIYQGMIMPCYLQGQCYFILRFLNYREKENKSCKSKKDRQCNGQKG